MIYLITILHLWNKFSTEIYSVIVTIHVDNPDLYLVASAELHSHHTAAGGLCVANLADGAVKCLQHLVIVIIITPRENPRRRSVGPPSVQAIGWSLRFSSGFQKKSAKILTMEAKTVKTNTRTKSRQKRLKSAKSYDYIEPL